MNTNNDNNNNNSNITIFILEWNGICFSGQRPSTGTGKVIQRLRREKKKEDRVRKSTQQN